jgi:zinc protease
MYRQHSNPPGKMALMIHVDTGSLNETDAQRGLAHFLEHMAFNGTEHFAPATSSWSTWRAIGMQFGADLNAMTSFDQTMYMLFLPDTKTDQRGRGLKALSDWSFRIARAGGDRQRARRDSGRACGRG